ncbi:hypothetical protein A11M_0102005 [Xanthomonas vasicola pv. vasculorum NCPPB 895]|nr:hypothetical protein A11M_0102005 [Xanthomonas vasicola pv. vasculorum NCPPB 895]KGR52389.1 hypothetical protein NX07_10880 [Xanthomonas vasicola]KGR55947.1 hypothetical protein NX09_10205 [Xanthomonas vasicola]KGT84328.1 hypothetical protein OC00_08955 [Xanthomonas vasicola]
MRADACMAIEARNKFAHFCSCDLGSAAVEKKIFSWRTGGKQCLRTGFASVPLKRSSGCEGALLKKNSGKEVLF